MSDVGMEIPLDSMHESRALRCERDQCRYVALGDLMTHTHDA